MRRRLPALAALTPAGLACGGLLVMTALTRFLHLDHGLPAIPGADEPVVYDRAQQLLGWDLPEHYDWPTGAMVLLAGWLRAAGAIGLDATYHLARVPFALASFALVPMTGVLAGALVTNRAQRLLAAAVAMAPLVVAYPLLRLGRTLHPDPVQAVLVVVCLLATLHVVDEPRSPRWRWILLAGFAAGLAGGTKYLGGLAVVPLAFTLVRRPDVPLRVRLGHLAAAAGSAIAGLVVAIPAMLVHPSDVIDGLRFQATHQSGGHLGYEGEGTSLWWHLATALPGAWGWLWTVLAVAAFVAAVARGTERHRAVALYVAVGYIAVGWGVVQFPHYVLVYLAPLAALTGAAGAGLVGRAGRTPPLATAVVALVVLLASVGPALDGVRLLRAERATDTRNLAAEVARSIDGPLLKEQYTDSSPVGTRVARLADRPDVLGCGCVVAISSYNEERYRADPERYGREVAVYDGLRRQGRVLAVVRPDHELSYRWDVLPQWGLGDLPLTGDVGAVGPTITFLDLR